MHGKLLTEIKNKLNPSYTLPIEKNTTLLFLLLNASFHAGTVEYSNAIFSFLFSLDLSPVYVWEEL